MKYIIALLVAYSRNERIIGKGKHDLPDWRLRTDFKRFSEMTKESGVVIMGRNTYESLPEKFRPLPDRKNIIISSTLEQNDNDSIIVCQTLDDAIEQAKQYVLNATIYIIGGEQVYVESMPIADVVYATEVYGEFTGDKHFPVLTSSTSWIETQRINNKKTDKDTHDFDFVTYEKIE